MVKRKNEEIQDDVLAGQIPEFNESVESESFIGKKLPQFEKTNKTDDDLTKHLGANLFDMVEAHNGWINVDRRFLKERGVFYPEDWQFMIRPATVEAIRNWSLLDETNANSIDDVFNDILKYCLSIKTSTGTQPWQVINNWDRFFFVLLIREYTFVKGENNIEFYEDCENCETSIKFTLSSNSLMYDVPDESVMQYYDNYSRTWNIAPSDFGVEYNDNITLYVPTVERDANIKAWLMGEYQENDKKKFDNVFIKFLPWMLPKVSKEFATARMQIRKAEMVFKSWDSEMFSFMNDVIKNISVTPSTNIKTVCASCGEEATTRLRFPDGVGALFNVVNRRSKFGTK